MFDIENLAKLLAGIIAFVLIRSLGARDKRVGGALLTFPLLNGIALLTGANPFRVAGVVYPVVMWNALLFVLVIYWCSRRQAVATKQQVSSTAARVLAWTILWAAGASVLFYYFIDLISHAGFLFGVQIVLVLIYVLLFWEPSNTNLEGSRPSSFAKMWFNGTAAWLIGTFVCVFFVLSAVAQYSSDPKLVGLASTLPLPGIFALATISVGEKRGDLLPMRDTALFGPLLVIPFNWLLAQTLSKIRIEQTGIAVELLVTLMFWTAAFCLVYWGVPPMAKAIDVCRQRALQRLPRRD